MHPDAYKPGLEAVKTFSWLAVAIYETEQPLAVLLTLFTIYSVLLRILIQYAYQDHGQNRRPLFSTLALVIFLICATVDIIVSLQKIHFPYTLHLGVLILFFAVEDIFYRDSPLNRRHEKPAFEKSIHLSAIKKT